MKRLKWLPNLITFARAILAIFAFISVLKHQPVPAFWFFIAAVSTDFLDGLAAKKLNAASRFGAEFDAYVDAITVLLGVLGLNMAGYYPWWVFIAISAIAIVLGIIHKPTTKWQRHRPIFEVASLFAAWIGIIWSYAYLAFGWSWLYVILTVLIVVTCALLKRNRMEVFLKYDDTRIKS